MHPVTLGDSAERTSQRPRVVAIIPARYQSTRFPGKPLAEIAGRPMIEHVWRRVIAVPQIDIVIVATDDARIASTVERFGGVARMTRSTHRTGTDRVAEVAADLECDIILNVQGDLPAIEPDMIGQVVVPFENDAVVQMTTVRQPITDGADYVNPNVVKVVVDRHGDALYFSRSPVPFVRDGGTMPVVAGAVGHASNDLPYIGAAVSPPFYRHIGLYAYRRASLLLLAALSQSPLEIAESLEQLRALEYGLRIRTVETQHNSIEVDTLQDMERVQRHLNAAAPVGAEVRFDASRRA